MANSLRCPRCGEEERLLGRHDESSGGPEGIVVECLACRLSWPRGVRPCASCGGTDVVDRPQTMTRTPRGNQLAVIGTRTIRLCARCDVQALQASLAHNQPVPDGYAARYRHETGPGDQAGEQDAGRAERPRSAPAAPAAESQPRPPVVGPTHRRERGGPSPARARRTSQPAEPAAPTTVRQAVGQSLEEGVEADPTVVVLLGAQLGASTRLSEVDDPQAWTRVWSWVTSTWPDPDSPAGRRARQTITGLLTHWRERGWLTRVPTDSA